MIEIDVDVDNEVNNDACPSSQQIKQWAISALLSQRIANATVAIKLFDEEAMRELNMTYRKKDKPTNVLSFPSQLPEALNDDFLGDIAICAPIVQKEALSQNKTFEAHFAHLVVHGILHLLGFDHENESDAHKMETLEVHILHDMGFNDPYLTEITHD